VTQTIREAVEAFSRDVCAESVDELTFPTSLDASRRVLRAVENPDIGIADLSKIVVAEPLLSAKVIRLANSFAINQNNQPVLDVRHAVLRVGMDPIRALAMVLIMDQLRQAQRHAGCRALCNQMWEHSVHVAALSFVLARKLTQLNADEAMFAGIVHDLGRFYLLSRVPDYPVLLEDIVVLAKTIDDIAEQSSQMVLTQLKLPPTVVDAVLASRQYSGAMPPASLADILFIAGAVSPCRDPFEDLDARITPEAEGAARFGLDQGTVSEVIAASGDEIYSIVVALES